MTFLPPVPLPTPLVDVNVHLSRWPFRRLPGDETSTLVEHLKKWNVSEAWVGSYDAMLHLDLADVNRRLLKECQQAEGDLLKPVGMLNPTLPGWQRDLEWCFQQPEIIGLRLYPGCHHYALDAEMLTPLWERCAAERRLVQIVMRMEDSRTQHPSLRVSAVDLTALKTMITRWPQVKLQLLNAGRDVSPALAGQLAKLGSVYFETSFIEGTGGVERFLRFVPPQRVTFGSHFPFFYFEAALFKLIEADLGHRVTTMLTCENALALRQ